MSKSGPSWFPRGWRLFALIWLSAVLFRVIAGGPYTWAQIGLATEGIVVVSGAFAGVFWVVSRVQSARLARVRSEHPGASAWIVNFSRLTQVLVIDSASLSLYSTRGDLRRTWPRDQVLHAVIERVPIGWPPRPGLRLELGRHTGHETVRVAFPSRLGMWSSAEDAQDAKQAIEAT
jgi:hypothetical protein